MKKYKNLIHRMKQLWMRLIILMCGVLFCAHTSAQSITITGKVIDNTGASLPGVTIMQKGTNKGVITDYDGNYNITLDKINVELIYSFVGYAPQTVLVDGSNRRIDITLLEDMHGIEEVVVVGYGTQRKVNLTGSVEVVRPEQLVKRQTGSMSAALQGLMPGVTVQQRSGNPGSDGAKINIRGVGSISAGDDPLVLVDGVEMDINQIDMNIVASVSVLKDAASASIYGSRAANGVILITTKRAREAGVRVNYSGSVTMQQPSIALPKPVGAVEFMKQHNIAAQLDAKDPNVIVHSLARIEEYEIYGADNFNRYDADWSGLLLKDHAWMNSHSLNIEAGGEKIKTFVAASYFGQDGLVVANNNFNRLTLRMNNDIKFNNWLRMDLDMNIRQSETVRPNIGDNASYLFYAAMNFSPLFASRYDDGRWGYGLNGTNPGAIVNDGGNITALFTDVVMRGALITNPFKGFEGMVSYSYRQGVNRTSTLRKAVPLYDQNRLFGTWPTDGNFAQESWNNSTKRQFNAQATYNFVLDASHEFTVMSGMQTEEWYDTNFSASRRNFEVEGFYFLNNGDAETMSNAGTANELAIASFFGRLNYNYQSKYLLEINARYDGSSRFIRENRWGFFPSVSAGWRISQESFMESLSDVVSNLKIRGSWGQLGNQAINTRYPFTSILVTSPNHNYFFDKGVSNGVTLTELNNPNIIWETSEQINVALEMGFLKNRIMITTEFFERTIKDMLMRLPLPYMVGYEYPWQNAGVMKNTGWEITTSYRDRIGDVSYSITGTLGDVVNKVTDLKGQHVYDGGAAIIEGEALRSYWGYKAIGYFQDDIEVANEPVVDNNRNLVQPGDVKFADLSGPEGEPDGMIDINDRIILGNPFPRYEYSLNLGASWKGFDLTAFFQGVGKREYFISGHGVRPLNVGSNMFEHQLDYWTPENPNAEYPRLSHTNNFNWAISSKWVRQGSYFRMKNLVLGYTLPPEIINRMPIQRARIYCSSQNLFTVSNFFTGYDPEVSYSNGSFYPVMKTFTLGLDITF